MKCFTPALSNVYGCEQSTLGFALEAPGFALTRRVLDLLVGGALDAELDAGVDAADDAIGIKCSTMFAFSSNVSERSSLT